MPNLLENVVALHGAVRGLARVPFTRNSVRAAFTPEDADPRPTLYFLHATGCEACEMAKPEVAAFYRAYGSKVRVVPVDLTVAEWRAKKWEPEATPAFVVRFPDGTLSEKMEGYAPGEFAKWLGRVFPRGIR